MRASLIAGVAALASLVPAGCGGGGGSTGSASTNASAARSSIQLTSSAFTAGGAIPRAYTCDGRDISLPVRWSGVPSSARELILVMRDPDAPGGNFIHWALAGISPATTAVQAGRAPAGAIEGRNGFGTVGYRGPCPPTGDPAHHYVLTLTALGSRARLGAGFSAAEIPTAALATGTLVGTYARH